MDIKEIIQIIDSSSIQYFEAEDEGSKIIIAKYEYQKPAANVVAAPVEHKAQAVAEAKEAPKATEAPKAEKPDNDAEICVVKSPIMGTFYAAPEPDAPAFVSVGDKVSEGDALCILEAMKLMNEITSDVNGEIIEILVMNEDLVEFNQPLFKIRVD